MNKKTILLPTAILAFLTAILGFTGGIVRLGSPYIDLFPFFPATIASMHPDLVIIGFFMLVIIMERVIGLEIIPSRPSYFNYVIFPAQAAALLLAIGSFFGNNQQFGTILINLGFISAIIAVIVMIMIQIWMIQNVPQNKSEYLLGIFGFGIILFYALKMLVNWTGGSSYSYVFLVLYLVLIILGERIGFGRLQSISQKNFHLFENSAMVLGALLFVGIILSFFVNSPFIFFGNLLLLLTLVLIVAKNDSSLRTPKIKLPMNQYLRVALFGSYLWIILAIFLLVWHFFNQNFFLYDAGLHAITVGFILTMFIAHAPIIFPTLLKRRSISSLPGGTLWLFGLWLLLGVRILGDLLIVLTELSVASLQFVIGLSGYLMIPFFIAYLIVVLYKIRSMVTIG